VVPIQTKPVSICQRQRHSSEGLESCSDDWWTKMFEFKKCFRQIRSRLQKIMWTRTHRFHAWLLLYRYDGVCCGSSISDFHISKLDNARAIDSLPVCPFSVVERDGMVDSEKLAKRGREFIRCTQSCHLHYSGRSQIRQPYGDYLNHQSNNDSGRVSRVFSKNIYSEVMIEYDRALQRNSEWLSEIFELNFHKHDP